jgi:hypothetical protein
MSTQPIATPGDSSARALKERLERVERDLIQQRKRVDATTTLTTIIGLIALIAIAVYAYIGYKGISETIEPNRLVDFTQAVVDENLPTVRGRLESEIIQSAPDWAGTLSKQALSYLPVGRKELERKALENIDEALAQTRSITNEQFRAFVDKNKDHLSKQFEELAKSPDLAESSLVELQTDLEKDLGVNFQKDAEALLKEIRSANHAFKKLQDGKNLDEQQQLERRAWMLARALRREGLDVSTTGLPEISETSATEKPVVLKKSDGKPTKRSPVPGDLEEGKKGSPAGDKKNGAAPDAGKKKEAAPEADKKKDPSPSK